MNGNTALKLKPKEEIEYEALEFFLSSVQREANERFPSVSAFVSHAGSIPQLVIFKRDLP
jgi:hypothetical protein